MTIESDELGHIGETKFSAMCAEVGLICNQSLRDRAGWDFIVDFPQESNVLQVFDKRAAPLSCAVQVKSVNVGQRTISLRLTAAERLAKDPKPAFVYVPSIDKSRSVKAAHLIHIHGNRLAAILQRLRKEAADGNKSINKRYINFTITDEDEIEPTAGALKAAIEAAMPDGLVEYIQLKRNWANKTGYEGVVASVKTTIQATAHEMVDLFLGLSKNVKAINTTVFDHRFNIKLEEQYLPECLISITPVPIDKCKLVATDPSTGKRTSIKCEIFRPAIQNLSPDLAKIRVKGGLIDVVISKSELDFTCRWGDDITAPFDDWCKFISFCAALEQPGFELEFLSDSGQLDWKLHPHTVRLESDGFNPASMNRIIDHLAAVLRGADVYDDVDCTFSWIESSLNHAALIDKAMQGFSQDFNLSGRASEEIFGQLQGRGAFSSVIKLPEGVIIYAGVGDFIGGQDGELGTLKTENLRISRIRHYHSYSEEIHKQFVDDFFSQNNIGFCVSTMLQGTAFLRMNN